MLLTSETNRRTPSCNSPAPNTHLDFIIALREADRFD